MKIIKANSDDAQEITALVMRSKNYWNYGEEQMEKWREELTITSEYINKYPVYKLINNDKLVGFYAYNQETTEVVKLNFLFIDPTYIGGGFGKILINDLLERLKETTCKRIVLDADPNAENFYSHMGFEVIGQLKSSIKDRSLPIMELKINRNKS